MFRFISFIAIFFFSQFFASAQNWNRVYSLEVDAENYINEKRYDLAAKKFIDALKIIPNSAALKYKVGYCYLQTPDRKHLAIEYLISAAENIAIDFNPKSIKELRAPPETLFFLGKAYLSQNQFSRAIEAFESYKEYLNPNDDFNRIVDININSCLIAPSFIENGVGLRPINLGETINSKNQNFNAVFSGNEEIMAYTTLSDIGYRVYIATKKGDEWNRPIEITREIRANFLKTSYLSHDGTELLLIDDFSKKNNIYQSTKKFGVWSKAKKLGSPINSKYNETHAILTKDGKTIYFVSDRPGGSGGLDIYKSTKNEKGNWTKPINLGPRINTEFNENTPFLSHDEKYLFFSSEGHNGMGGYDIYVVEIEGNGKPINLGYPVNNTVDNTFFYPSLIKNTGYTAYYNKGGNSVLDIHFLKILPLVNLSGTIAYENTQEANSSSSTILAFQNLESMNDVELSVSSNMNSFTKRLSPGNYRVIASKEGYYEFETKINIPDEYETTDFHVDIHLKPKETESLLALESSQEVFDVEPLLIEETSAPLSTANAEIPTQTNTIVHDELTRKIEKEIPKVIYSSPLLNPNKYTVQIMALVFPINPERLSNIPDLMVITGSDGYHRYVVGTYETTAEAKIAQQRLIEQGFPEAFVRRFPAQTDYTIQLMALKKPVELEFFKNISEIDVCKGDDGFYRYTTGTFNSQDEAKELHSKLISLGYKDAFIRRR